MSWICDRRMTRVVIFILKVGDWNCLNPPAMRRIVSRLNQLWRRSLVGFSIGTTNISAFTLKNLAWRS
jgi:hypothetical protein